MHPFDSLGDLHGALDALIGRELAARHERRPGQKEDRYSHLLGGEEDDDSPSPQPAGDARRAGAPEPDGGAPQRQRDAGAGEATPAGDALAALAERVAQLEQGLADLHASLQRNGAARPAPRPRPRMPGRECRGADPTAPRAS